MLVRNSIRTMVAKHVFNHIGIIGIIKVLKMEPKLKIILGSILVGIAVFTGLGLIGSSDDTIGILFQNFGIDEENSFRLSKLVLGVSIGGAIWFLMFGYTELRDGIDVTFKRN